MNPSLCTAPCTPWEAAPAFQFAELVLGLCSPHQTPFIHLYQALASSSCYTTRASKPGQLQLPGHSPVKTSALNRTLG